MSRETLYYWQVAGTLTTLIPLVMGFYVFKQSLSPIRIFLGYLIIGFMTDLTGWYLYVTQNGEANMYVRHAYDLFEAVFLFWFIGYTSTSSHLKKFSRWALVPLFIFWATRFWFSSLAVFKTGTQVMEAFGLAFCILKLLESDAFATQRPIFWLWLGVFFYCFGTIFLMGVLDSRMPGVWYAHAIINMLAYLIYTVGFWRVRQQV
ncbi:MAG: hypothetical protein KIT62_03550 [Cyclobacteriaceae bacterium]|nr:hypothetical protein [Cyclobacteriaceae bacterium]